MTVLSLPEAAEQAAASKVDVWRAIRDGALPAQRTRDGGYAIDPADLFRVFERKGPRPGFAPPAAAFTPEGACGVQFEGASELDAAPEISAAFAELQAELKSLLGASANAAPAGRDERRVEAASTTDPSEQNGRPADLVGARPTPAATDDAASAGKRVAGGETRWRWRRRP